MGTLGVHWGRGGDMVGILGMGWDVVEACWGNWEWARGYWGWAGMWWGHWGHGGGTLGTLGMGWGTLAMYRGRAGDSPPPR